MCWEKTLNKQIVLSNALNTHLINFSTIFYETSSLRPAIMFKKSIQKRNKLKTLMTTNVIKMLFRAIRTHKIVDYIS